LIIEHTSSHQIWSNCLQRCAGQSFDSGKYSGLTVAASCGPHSQSWLSDW
jgi:hypothetical protein